MTFRITREPVTVPGEVRRRRRVDRDRAHLDAVNHIDVEGAVGTGDRLCEVAMTASDRQISNT